MTVEHDEIGIWSEVKLAIIKEYASTYTKIMDAQRRERIPACGGSTLTAMPGPDTTSQRPEATWSKEARSLH